jgi:hypothetical protein
MGSKGRTMTIRSAGAISGAGVTMSFFAHIGSARQRHR